MGKTAVIYARYSSDKQREASIDDQIRVCREFCASQGVEVVEEYKDYAMSGKTDHRPEFRRMIAAAPESDWVVVYMFDRFSRDRYDAATYKRTLRECGVRVVSATEKVEDTPEGGLQEGLLEILSEYYVKDLARKVRRGMEGNALKAQDNGYRIFGYDTDPETRRYVVNDAEAASVREMFQMRVSGRSINSIAREMASRGLVTATGKPVDYNWAHRVLTRRAYTGLYSWGGIEVEGGMPQIVDEATFERARRVPPMRRGGAGELADFKLTGRLYCGLCGRPMHGAGGTGKKGRRYYYYACKEDGGCKRSWVRREVLEDAVANAVLDVCSDEGRMRMVARRVVDAYAEADETPAEIEACEGRMRELEREQARLTDAAMKGFVNDSMIERNEEIKLTLKNLENRLGVLRSQEAGLTEDDIVEFLTHGFDREDEGFVLGSAVKRVWLFDDCALVVFSFRDEVGDLAETRVALEDAFTHSPVCPPENEKRREQRVFSPDSSGVGGGI